MIITTLSLHFPLFCWFFLHTTFIHFSIASFVIAFINMHHYMRPIPRHQTQELSCCPTWIETRSEWKCMKISTQRHFLQIVKAFWKLCTFQSQWQCDTRNIQIIYEYIQNANPFGNFFLRCAKFKTLFAFIFIHRNYRLKTVVVLPCTHSNERTSHLPNDIKEMYKKFRFTQNGIVWSDM